MSCNILYPLKAFYPKALIKLKDLEWEPAFVLCADGTWHNGSQSLTQVPMCCYNINTPKSMNSRMEILTFLVRNNARQRMNKESFDFEIRKELQKVTRI